jgi:hypothetical protein
MVCLSSLFLLLLSVCPQLTRHAGAGFRLLRLHRHH